LVFSAIFIRMYYRGILLLVLLFQFNSSSQNELSKKQLLEIVAQPINDTTLLNAYNELTWPIYSYDIPDSSIYYGKKAIALATKLNDVKRLSIAHRRLGISYSNNGDIKESIYHQQISYDLSEKINFKRGMQLALNNIGVAYLNNEIYNKALTYFLRALKLAEETKNYSGVEQIYYNCSLIYRHTNDVKKSKECLFKAITYARAKQDSALLLILYSGLSTESRNNRQIDSAFYYQAVAKKYLNKRSSTNSKFSYFLNEGLLLSANDEHQKALDIFLASKSYATITNDEITLLINIAEEYAKLKMPDKALHYFQLAYDISYKTKTYNNLSYLSLAIANLYESKNDYKNFSKYIHLNLNFKDSNDKYTRVQQIHQQQLEFDYERKQIADSLRFEHKENLKNKELEIAAEKLNNEKIFRVMLLLILAGIVFFAFFTFKRLKITRQQNRIIEKQKQLVELKNHEILDSINYAKRLQTAILPQLTDIKKVITLDILYLPKDIIGGDFYFFEQYKGYTFFAVCDCTGHGIPGALMSVVCHNALHKAITEFNLLEPGHVLTKARELVIESLNAKQQNIRDGMDCTLICFHNESRRIQWAGANNHLCVLQDGDIREYKADKQPVAFYENEKEFITHTLTVESGDLLYLLSDGYGDQFGGARGKKYKNKTLKEFLLSIQSQDENEQVKSLHQNILHWKGELDQVDDITVAVIRF
jgi:serine phosphatase RsbU (regulator of sigma subunit)